MPHWSERHRVLFCVFLILRKDGRILLLRRANTGYMDGKLGLPSGHADGDEPATIAMIREAKEEAGVEVRPEDLRMVFTLHRKAEEGTHEYIDLFFEADDWRGEPRNMEPEKCSELVWADAGRLPDDIIPAINAPLLQLAAGKTYGELYFEA